MRKSYSHSGHRSIEALRMYERITPAQEKAVSTLLAAQTTKNFCQELETLLWMQCNYLSVIIIIFNNASYITFIIIFCNNHCLLSFIYDYIAVLMMKGLYKGLWITTAGCI